MMKCIQRLTIKGDRRSAYRQVCRMSAALVPGVQGCGHCLRQLERITLDEIARMRAESGQGTEEKLMFENYKHALALGSQAMVLQGKIEGYLWFHRTTLTEPVPVN